MIRARKEGRSEEELIAAMSQAHQRDFAGFDIEFDHYGSTHSDANRELCGQFWQSLREAGLVDRASGRPALRSGSEDVPGRPVRAGNLSQVRALPTSPATIALVDTPTARPN